jgi:hypothetical protein
MNKLIFPDDIEKEKFLNGMCQSLLKNFNLRRSRRIDEAVLLSAYFVALGRGSDAIRLLESFVNDVVYDGDEAIWGSVGQGIVLLASLYRGQKNHELEAEQIKRIVNEDILSSRCSRAEFLSEDLSVHQEIMSYASTETKKYKCAAIAQEILKFLYYLELWPTFLADVHSSEREVVERLVNDSYAKLKEALLE